MWMEAAFFRRRASRCAVEERRAKESWDPFTAWVYTLNGAELVEHADQLEALAMKEARA